MIFVTVGTQDKKFNRLLDAVGDIDIDEEIIIQSGCTNFKSSKSNIIVVKYMDEDEYLKTMLDARMIICHAGVGTILQGLKLKKKMIVAPRLKKYNEHVNDHQLQIVEVFKEAGYVLALYDFSDLKELIDLDFVPNEFESNNENFNKLLEKEIN